MLRFNMMSLFAFVLPFYAIAASDSIQPITEDLPPTEEVLQQDYQLGDEVQMLEDLISITEKTLVAEKEILQAVKDFYEKQLQYLNKKQDRKLAYEFINQASHLKELINSYDMDYLFRQEFLEELATLSEVRGQEGVSN